MKICHLTSVHERYDIRIFLKQCRSLARGPAMTSRWSSPMGAGRHGVRIVDAGKQAAPRPLRMTRTTRRVFEPARSTGSDIYHLHGPELIPIGLRLKREGAKVVFDSHEDFITDILTKPYLKFGSARAVSTVFGWFEKRALASFDGVVSAYDAIAVSYRGIASRVINNYPIEEEIVAESNASIEPGFAGAGRQRNPG
jgi:hypothetical protein